jgi:hypothetical protein
MHRAYPACDVDVYKILQRYFSNHPNLDWHELRVNNPVDVH